jgi:hypothetical protein
MIRMALIGEGVRGNPYRIDLPTYTTIASDETTGRAFADVPPSDVPADVAAFVAAYPTVDLTTPLPVPFPQALARTWAEFLARRYDLGETRWHPVVF